MSFNIQHSIIRFYDCCKLSFLVNINILFFGDLYLEIVLRTQISIKILYNRNGRDFDKIASKNY